MARKVATVATAYAAFRIAQRAASAAVDVMTGALKHGIAEAIAFENASLRLGQAMKAGGTYTQESYELVRSYASALQKTTIYTENEILAAEAMLATFKLQPDVLREALGLTLDLAAATGQELVQAAVLTGKAAVGVTGTLSRYGIIVDQADLKTRGFAAVVDEMNKNFGGTAQALVSGYTGQLGMLSKAWDDTTKAVGEYITKSPEVIGLFQALTTELDLLTGSFVENADAADRLFVLLFNKLGQALIDLQPLVARTAVLWNLFQISMYASTQQSQKATAQFDDLWKALTEGNEFLKEVGEGFLRVATNQDLNAAANRRLREVQEATAEQLPWLREEINNVNIAMAAQGEISKQDADYLAALERRIKDLTATTKTLQEVITSEVIEPLVFRAGRDAAEAYSTGFIDAKPIPATEMVQYFDMEFVQVMERSTRNLSDTLVDAIFRKGSAQRCGNATWNSYLCKRRSGWKCYG
jgi:hypothetical protein